MKKQIIIGIAAFLFIGILCDKYYAVIRRDKFKKLRDLTSGYQSEFLGALVKDEDGLKVFIDTHDHVVSQSVLANGSWEPHIRNILKQIIKPTMKVICLGGHVGLHEVLASKLVGPNGKVFVFEPNTKILEFTRANIFFAEYKNITLFEKAAYSENKELRFASRKPDLNSGGSHILRDNVKLNAAESDEIIVDAVTLDSISEFADGVDIIQMDIEGAEPDAMYGAQKLIDRSPNLIVLQEWSPEMMQKEQVPMYLKFWRDRGYKFAEIRGDVLVEKTDDELLASPHSDVILAKNLDEIIANFKPYVKPLETN